MAKKIRDNALNQGTSKLLFVYVTGLLISVLVLASLYGYVAVQTLHDKEYTSLVGDNRLNALHIAKFAYQASLGDAKSFEVLQQKRDQFDSTLGKLVNGDEANGLPPSPESVLVELDDAKSAWNDFRDKIDIILSFKDSMLAMRQATQSIEDINPV